MSDVTQLLNAIADLSGAWTRLTDLIARTNSRVESVTDLRRRSKAEREC
jgi:hypothetical protein